VPIPLALPFELGTNVVVVVVEVAVVVVLVADADDAFLLIKPGGGPETLDEEDVVADMFDCCPFCDVCCG
jgi:hypothetical protein